MHGLKQHPYTVLFSVVICFQMEVVHLNCMIRLLIIWKTCFLGRGSKPRSSQKVSIETPDLIRKDCSDSVYRCSIWDRVMVLQWSWLDLWFIEPILISSSSVVPVFVSVCLWSGAPCLRHHVVRFPSRSHVTTGAFLTLSSLMCLFFTLLSPPVWYSPSLHCITSTKYRRPSIRLPFLQQHQPKPPPRARRRTKASQCFSHQVLMGRTSQPSQISDIFLHNLKNVIYCSVVFFTPTLKLIAVGTIYIPLISFLSALLLQWSQWDLNIVLFEKSSAIQGCFMPYLSNSFCY